MKNIIEVYCFIDNFVKLIEVKTPQKPAGRKSTLTKTDYITLAIVKQDFGIKTTKQLYEFVQEYMQRDFPVLPSYQQFNHGIKSTFRYFMIIVLLITKINRRNGSQLHTTRLQNYLLAKRQSIESVFSYLKHRLSAINGYARSIESFFVNVFSAIVTYTLNLKNKNMSYLSDFSMALIS